MTAMRFEGKVAAVTGGGSGIGAAICQRLAEEGAIVGALDLSVDRAQAVSWATCLVAPRSAPT